MRRDTKLTSGSSIYELIQQANMTQSDRQVALNALRQADWIVEALAWVVTRIGRGGARVFLKPGLKH